MDGFFITMEGGEGAGKTTLIGQLEQYIRNNGRQVITTREPGGIEIAEQIRAILLHPNHRQMDARTEALLYAAARRQHLVEKITPALEQGNVVICDRYIDSSLAYQGYARGLGIEEVLAINEFAIRGLWPDLTFYFDLHPETGLERISRNKEREINRLDQESLLFHERVREGYRLLAKQYAGRIVTIDASRPQDEVFLQVKKVIDERMS